jgi:hypothetical protein
LSAPSQGVSTAFGGCRPSGEHRPHVKRDAVVVEALLAAVFVGGIGEDIADGGEVAGRMYVREGANVAVDRSEVSALE